MEHKNDKLILNAGPSLASSIIGLGTIVGAHLIMTFLFWMCLNPALRAFGFKAISFGACFFLWSAWLMIVLVPAIVVLNIVKSMWPPPGDALMGLLSSSYKNDQL